MEGQRFVDEVFSSVYLFMPPGALNQRSWEGKGAISGGEIAP